MRKLKILGLLIAILSLITVAGCGGGGGGGTPPPPPPTTAVLTISTTTLGASPQIGGIYVTVTMPPGVSVQADVDGNVINPDTVIVPSGVVSPTTASVAFPFYDSTTRDLSFLLFSTDPAGNGFGVGQFVTVNCNLSAGSRPAAGDFTAVIDPYDLSYAKINDPIPVLFPAVAVALH